MEEKRKAILEKAKKSKWLIIGVAGFIVLLVILRIVFNPAIHYSRGEKLFDAGKFASSAEHFLKAGDYKDASSKAKIATNAQDYAEGEAKFEAGYYSRARLNCGHRLPTAFFVSWKRSGATHPSAR